VRALDGVCRAPGCGVPAAATDLDHHIPFDHADPVGGGPTTEDNLSCRCRRHHRLKTLADNGCTAWRVRQHPGRRVEWITPTGASVITEPEGAAYLFPCHRVTPMRVLAADPVASQAPSTAVEFADLGLPDRTELEAALAEIIDVYTTPAQRRPEPLETNYLAAAVPESDTSPPF
jgi:hypothetical protein